MKISKDKIINQSGKTIADGIFLTALMETLGHDDKFRKFLEGDSWRNQETVDVQFIVGGVEMDLLKVCERWDNQVDKMVKKMALELVEEKFRSMSNFISDLETEIRQQVSNELGIVIEDW